MKRLFLTFAIFIMALSVYGQDKLPDAGITSETHKNNIGKTLFSKTEVLFKKENLNTWTTSFNWGDPIYARMYWAEGINNVYQKNGWAVPHDTYRYVLRFFANGELFKEFIVQTNGERTSLPLCLYPDKSDTYDWGEKDILSENIGIFKPGENKIKVEVCAYTRDGNIRSEPLSSGTFSLFVTKEDIGDANKIYFSKIETHYPSSDDWNDWVIKTSNGKGELKSQWSNKAEWTFKINNIKGTIKTRFRDDFTNWILEYYGEKVFIEQRFSNDWKTWTITEGDTKITVETRYQSGNDAWTEWKVTGDNGTMTIKTHYYSSDGRWKNWDITDNMPNIKPEQKMAAIFIAIFQALP